MLAEPRLGAGPPAYRWIWRSREHERLLELGISHRSTLLFSIEPNLSATIDHIVAPYCPVALIMADARSLLRNERAGRRINHPQASYTESGKLMCTICNAFIRTESLWSNHLKSTQHSLRLQSSKDASTDQYSKKRKAETTENDERKRLKIPDEGDADGIEGVSYAVGDELENVEEGINITSEAASIVAASGHSIPGDQAAPQQVEEDDAEWEAFQRDLIETHERSRENHEHATGVTISAAPMSAEEIAAQAREEQSVQGRGHREAEIEAEREDAARALEDEFQEMEDLEERVRKLREKREMLRGGLNPTSNVAHGSQIAERLSGGRIRPSGESPAASSEVRAIQDEDDDDQDGDDDFDDWNFGAK